MKKRIAILTILIALFASSCSVIEGVFNAGMSIGIFITVFLIAVILFVVFRLGNKNQ